MSSASTAQLMPSSGPSSTSLAGHRNVSQHPLVPSSSSSSSRAPSSRIAPAHTSSSQTVLAASPPKPKAAPLAPNPSAIPSSAPLVKNPSSTGPLVQPTKEWVLPARAKPGRKPSETEPLTKRKAQNRASQRAFRERKQSYLAELEAKVAAYEAAEIDRSVEIQKVAKKLSQENEALKKEVGMWKEKFGQLERVLITAKANGGRLQSGVVASGRSGSGCKAPAHERAAAPKRGVLVAPGAKSKDRAAGVRFADAIEAKSETEVVAAAISLRRRASSTSTPSSTGSATPPAASPAAISPSKVVTEAATLPPRKGVKPPLWSFETTKPASPDAFSPSASTPSLSKSSSLTSPSLLPHGGHLSVEGGCGFCTEASPCVCADDFLDLSSQPQPSHIAVPSDVPSALPLPKRTPTGPSSTSIAAETSRRMSIGSLTHANDVLPLDQRRRGTTKLWYTVSQPTSPPSTTPVAINLKKSGGGKKLWSTKPASPEPVCTGDPSSCGACSTDPGLAAFCEAVTTATVASKPTLSSSSSLHPPVSASPPRPGMLRAGTTGMLPSSSSSYSSAGETIPSAWRQIRSHPRFSQWQGGLDLLAEVVSKRSGNVHSPLLSSAKRPREASVEIETPRATATASATSNDRTKPGLLHTASDSALVHVKREYEHEEEQGEGERESKRRRIVIDKEAVKEALALLDAGTAAQPRGGVGLGIGMAKDEGEVPCPCPWRPGDKQRPSP